MSPTIEELKHAAWSRAVAATYHAQEVRARAAWLEASQAWESMASLYKPAEPDKKIYLKMARDTKARIFRVSL
jgi:hypothetical protein